MLETSEEDVLAIDANGFLISLSDDEVEVESLREITQHSKRFQKWHNMWPHSENDSSSLDEMYENWLRVVKNRKLKSRIRKGIPPEYRRKVWVHASGSRKLRLKHKGIYEQILATGEEHEDARCIRADIKRTYTMHVLFKEENSAMHQSLFHVLNAYALYNTDAGYVSGLSFVAAFLLMQAEEVDVFWMLHSLLESEKYQMKDVWRQAMPGIRLRHFQFDRLLERFIPDVARHLQDNDVPCTLYCSRWFISLFSSTNVSTKILLRMWDIYLNEGNKAIFRFGLAIFITFQDALLQAEYGEIMSILRNRVSELTESFIESAVNIRITRATLQSLQKEYESRNSV